MGNFVIAYEDKDIGPTEARSHPWDVGALDPTHRYIDFRENPALIRTSLEDLLPWSASPTIQEFYGLLEWLNGAESVLESNDCAFRGPRENKDPKFTAKLQCDGRLMILYRDLALNLSTKNVEWLAGAVRHYLVQVDQGFDWGVVGTTIAPVQYITLTPPPDGQPGGQVQLSFWAWGDTEIETMQNMQRVFRNLAKALEWTSQEILDAQRVSEPERH